MSVLVRGMDRHPSVAPSWRGVRSWSDRGYNKGRPHKLDPVGNQGAANPELLSTRWRHTPLWYLRREGRSGRILYGRRCRCQDRSGRQCLPPRETGPPPSHDPSSGWRELRPMRKERVLRGSWRSPDHVIFYCGRCQHRWTAESTNKPIGCPICGNYSTIGRTEPRQRRRRRQR